MKKLIRALAATAFLTAFVPSAFAIGAIAVDDEVGNSPSNAGYGYSTGHSSKEEAAAAALAQCRSAGNDSCKAVVWFETCGAYASSRDRYGIGYGTSEGVARQQALGACGAGCRLVVSVCE